jgi:hypothetical protein
MATSATHSASQAATTPAMVTPSASSPGCAQAQPVFNQVAVTLATLHSASPAAATAAISSAVTRLENLQASLQLTDTRLAGQVGAFAAVLHTVGPSGASAAASINLNSDADVLVASCPGLHHDLLGG